MQKTILRSLAALAVVAGVGACSGGDSPTEMRTPAAASFTEGDTIPRLPPQENSTQGDTTGRGGVGTGGGT